MSAEPPPAGIEQASASLVRLVRAHGLGDAAAAHAVAAALDAGRREPWTRLDAAARRALLTALRRTADAATPTPGDPERLSPARLAPAARPAEWEEIWAALPSEERAVFAGALLDGMDMAALARAERTHRLEIKGRARRVLSRLTGAAARGSGLAAVRHMTAGEYALGLVPPDAVEPYRRALELDHRLQDLVAGWDALFAPMWETGAEGVVTHSPPPRPSDVAAAPNTPPPAVVAAGARRAPRWLVATLAGLAALGGVGWFVLASLGPPVATVMATLVPAEPVDEPLPAPRRASPAPPAAAATAPQDAAAQAMATARATRPPAADVAPPARAQVWRGGTVAVPRPELAAGVLPGGALAVRLHHRVDDPTSAARAGGLAERLRGLGARVELVDSGGLVVRSDRLRYFHAAEAAAVRALAAGLPAPFEVQDFTHYRPRPPVGTVELWLASEPSG